MNPLFRGIHTGLAFFIDNVDECLERSLADDSNSWDLGSDNVWRRRTPQGPEPRSVQRELMLGHQARAAEGATT